MQIHGVFSIQWKTTTCRNYNGESRSQNLVAAASGIHHSFFQLRKFLKRQQLIFAYKSYVQTIIRYGGLVYANTDKTKRLELEVETRRLIRIPFFTSAGWIQPLNYGFNQFMDSIAELIQSLNFISGGWIQLLNTLECSTIIEPKTCLDFIFWSSTVVCSTWKNKMVSEHLNPAGNATQESRKPTICSSK